MCSRKQLVSAHRPFHGATDHFRHFYVTHYIHRRPLACSIPTANRTRMADTTALETRCQELANITDLWRDDPRYCAKLTTITADRGGGVAPPGTSGISRLAMSTVCSTTSTRFQANHEIRITHAYLYFLWPRGLVVGKKSRTIP